MKFQEWGFEKLFGFDAPKLVVLIFMKEIIIVTHS